MQKTVWILVSIVGVLLAISSIIARDDAYGAIPALLLGLLGGGIYFIPAFIAAKRSHPNATAIVVLNTLAGWTFLGWIGSLVWALLRIKREGITQ